MATEHDVGAQTERKVFDVRRLRQPDQRVEPVHAPVQRVHQRPPGTVAVFRHELLHGRVERVFLRRQQSHRGTVAAAVGLAYI